MFEDLQLRQVAVAVSDIRDRPGGVRLRQLLFGEPVQPLEELGGHVRIRAKRDGYEGVIARADLGPLMALTHQVTALATHLYTAPDIKSAELMSLSFGSRLTIVEQNGPFSRTQQGHYVHSAHIALATKRFADPVAVAELFLGTPYLWGGNSRLGIDCSGLVQVACLACGYSCPGDSGDQAEALGDPLDAQAPLRRGDLLFWKGHVAWVAGPDRILHANAAYMATVYEGLSEAAQRILDQGDGPITARRRLSPRPS